MSFYNYGIREWRDADGAEEVYCYEGTTYDKGAPIYFIAKNGRRLRSFITKYLKIQNLKRIDEDERNYMIELLSGEYPDVHIVYPYDRIGEIIKFDEGYVFEYDVNKNGMWTTKTVKSPKRKIRRIKDWIY